MNIHVYDVSKEISKIKSGRNIEHVFTISPGVTNKLGDCMKKEDGGDYDIINVIMSLLLRPICLKLSMHKCCRFEN